MDFLTVFVLQMRWIQASHQILFVITEIPLSTLGRNVSSVRNAWSLGACFILQILIFWLYGHIFSLKSSKNPNFRKVSFTIPKCRWQYKKNNNTSWKAKSIFGAITHSHLHLIFVFWFSLHIWFKIIFWNDRSVVSCHSAMGCHRYDSLDFGPHTIVWQTIGLTMTLSTTLRTL